MIEAGIRKRRSPRASYAVLGFKTGKEQGMKCVQLADGRTRVDSGSPWEPKMGYSRAMRAGPMITVAGCVGINEDGTYPDTLEDQTRCAIERIRGALKALDAGLEQITRIRIYTTCIDRWEQIATVMGPTFAETRPPNVLVEVSRLVDTEALIEIEADAWVGTG